LPAVGVGHGLAHLLEHLEEARQILARVGALAQQGGERAAADQLHGEIRSLVGRPAHLVHGHNAGVLKLATDLRLLGEAASLLRLVARRPPQMTFDLSRLRFVSSLAMGVLMTYCRAAIRAGARICLGPGVQPMVREALTRADLPGLFEAVDSAGGGGAPGSFAVGGQNAYPKVDDVERTFRITWGQLVELERELEPLLWRARIAGAKCRTFTAAHQAFAVVRDELAGLIGFAGKHRGHPVLGSLGAYEVAYWKLYDAVAGLLAGRAAGTEEQPEATVAGLRLGQP
jgi:anti-anti-sigma regulatory factor